MWTEGGGTTRPRPDCAASDFIHQFSFNSKRKNGLTMALGTTAL
jgi:hypothetical protein